MKKSLLLVTALLWSLVSFAHSIPFDQYGNVQLSDYANYADNQVIKVIVTVTKDAANPDVGTGWGIGTIKPINNDAAAAAYEFQCQAASEEGAENVYEFTVASFKEYAKINGEYWVDEYDQSGITINLYNGAKLTSITVQSAAVAGASFNFESDAIGTQYATVCPQAGDASATVAANPTVAAEKSLHVLATNYRSYAKFPVALPAGKTLADIEKITFDIYFSEVPAEDYPQNFYKSVDCLFGETGATFVVDQPNVSINNLIGNESTKTWISKVIPLTSLTDADLLALNSFDFAIGINHNVIDYYLDNIVFVLKIDEAIPSIAKPQSKIFSLAGGIRIAGAGEKVAIYSVDGRLVKQTVAGDQFISMPKGLYIVKVDNGQTEKVLVK
jgi:hypothetical protein